MSLPVVTSNELTPGMRQITKGITVERHVSPREDQWWEADFDADETSWGDPENGDGFVFTTIHHREVRLEGKDCVNRPGVYTQTAIVTRADGKKNPLRVLIVTGKKTEIVYYGREHGIVPDEFDPE